MMQNTILDSKFNINQEYSKSEQSQSNNVTDGLKHYRMPSLHTKSLNKNYIKSLEYHRITVLLALLSRINYKSQPRKTITNSKIWIIG